MAAFGAAGAAGAVAAGSGASLSDLNASRPSAGTGTARTSAGTEARANCGDDQNRETFRIATERTSPDTSTCAPIVRVSKHRSVVEGAGRRLRFWVFRRQS